MTGWIRRRWAAALMSWVLLLVWVAAVTPIPASEPDGHVRLRTEWIPAATPNDGPVLRLSIEPLVPLERTTLTVSTPVQIVARPLGPAEHAEFKPAPAAPDRLALRAPLRRTGSSVHDFELLLSPGSTGVVEFVVEGRDANGMVIRNAIGIVAGESGSEGVERLGAIEFPATVLEPEKR